jgi:hypothetical protein
MRCVISGDPRFCTLMKGSNTLADYFADSRVINSMPHEHAFIWAHTLAELRDELPAAYRAADLGCSSGDFLRMLCDGLPGSVEPMPPAAAVGLERSVNVGPVARLSGPKLSRRTLFDGGVSVV